MLLDILFMVQLLITIGVSVAMIIMLRKAKRQQAQPVIEQKPRTQNTEATREMEKLRRLRSISLTEPLSERVRPRSLNDIVGQEEGIAALRAILCGPNPQHVIIYGPPGIGKTCAARLMLEEAKRTTGSPFLSDANFIEMDATCLRFDERAIADPLIGSVHDPIYQGAGMLGAQGIPQPKPGAVTKAHGGILFLDEIGELHPIQLNKLLKVLEDRKVMLESAYYSPDDSAVPRHIHDIFKLGFPADFRLVGATTRSPQDIPPAIRSRCMEVFFRPLTPGEVTVIATRGANRAGFIMGSGAADRVAGYALSGRDGVNIVQVAAGRCQVDNRRTISVEDIDWVLRCGRYAPRQERKLRDESRVGVVNGLGVFGMGIGAVMEIEAVALPALRGTGQLKATGIIDEEETGDNNHRTRRRSMASASLETVRTALLGMNVPLDDYNVHINYPGGVPVDGPSAGLAMAVAVYSAITGQSVDGRVAMTGEVSARGEVRVVGGVPAKVEAAADAGAHSILIPRGNLQTGLLSGNARVIPVDTLAQALPLVLVQTQPTTAASESRVLEFASVRADTAPDTPA